MGQHYLDPVQFMLGKDNTSPKYIEVDAPQQHPDAVGSWRRIEYTYDDGCKIVLDGANSDSEAAYIEGPYGKIFRGFRSTIPDIQKLVRSLPEPEPQVTNFSESVRTRQKFALNESNGHRSSTIVNLGVAAIRLGRNLEFEHGKKIVQQWYFGEQEEESIVGQVSWREPWRLCAGKIIDRTT